ncbi:hypothetical protein Tco_0950744, partial [Tanacetum coccineum]
YNSAYNSTYSSPTRLSVTENTRKNPGFEPDIQKGNYDATVNSATDIEIRGQVEDVSNDDDTTSSSVQDFVKRLRISHLYFGLGMSLTSREIWIASAMEEDIGDVQPKEMEDQRPCGSSDNDSVKSSADLLKQAMVIQLYLD